MTTTVPSPPHPPEAEIQKAESGEGRSSTAPSLSDLEGLTCLAAAFSAHTGQPIDAVGAASRIRQIHVGTGCLHACIHCYANPSGQLRQASLTSFSRLAREMGTAARLRHEPFPLLFLGAESDPSMIADFAEYADTWVSEMPVFQRLKVFTHGWRLGFARQQREFRRFCELLSRKGERFQSVALSVDTFSVLARRDPSLYVANVAANLRGLRDVIGLGSLKLQVTYPLSRGQLLSTSRATLSYWRDLLRITRQFPDEPDVFRVLDTLDETAERECASLTRTVLEIGRAAGLRLDETVTLARDGDAPYAAGRAGRLYRGAPGALAERALEVQRKQTLYPLVERGLDTHGIVLYPDGRARLVNYEGYRVGSWLADGLPVLQYLVEDSPPLSPWAEHDG